MADLADVERAILATLAGGLFNLPLQTDAGLLLTTDSGVQMLSDSGAGYVPGSVLTTLGGVPARLWRGWPTPSGLLLDLTGKSTDAPGLKVAQVTIFTAPGMARNTTRYLGEEFTQAAPPPTLLISVNAMNQATVNGAPAVGQVCGLLVGSAPVAQGYAYRVQAGDTCATIAAALAALVPGATASGVIVQLAAGPATGRCVQDGTVFTEVRRQVQVFRVSVWAPTHDSRDQLAAACDLTMAPLSRITLLTGETIYQRYAGTRVDDVPSRNEAWLRELTYSIEYPTNTITAAPEMLFGVATLNGGAPFDG